jgi:predicted small lipoprotein YifL
MRRTVLAALATVAVLVTLAGCGLRGGREGAPDSAPTAAPSSSEVSLDAVLDDLAEVDASLDDVTANLSEGEAAEGQE